jgi:hypothetical protein
VTTPPDLEHRAYLRRALQRGARQLRATVEGEPRYGWRDRTIGTRVRTSTAEPPRWLRVVCELHRWADGDWWTGNEAAAEVTGIPKPTVLSVSEWSDQTNRLRAELSDYIRATTCASDPVLIHEFGLPDAWWTSLGTHLDRLSTFPTPRVAVDQDMMTARLHEAFGDTVDPTVHEWTTAHADLHWANLTSPDLYLMDWEGWGRAPAGLDAATLYCHSLLAPATARQVHHRFADILTTPDGRLAQLYAAARLLQRGPDDCPQDLADLLRSHTQRLIVELT